MKIYIAGKITGDPRYKEKFKEVEQALTNKGIIALTPAVLPEGMEPGDYMRICFAMIDAADKVWFLQDYIDSKGAQLELAYCEYINKPYNFIKIFGKFKLAKLKNKKEKNDD